MTRLPAALSGNGWSMWGPRMPGMSEQRPAGFSRVCLQPSSRSTDSCGTGYGKRLAGQYGVSAGVKATGVLAWSAKRKMARLYHADLAELVWARYDKVTIQASVPGADGQQLGAGAEEQLDNRPDPRAREGICLLPAWGDRDGWRIWGRLGGFGPGWGCCVLA